MASGIPDFYRGVDIAYQALAQMITRPTYGGALGSYGSKTVTANTYTKLLDVSGKGMLYGGYLWLDHTASQKNSGPFLRMDLNGVFDDPFVYLSEKNIAYPRAYPLSLFKYDDVNFIYCVGFSYGLTFEGSFDLWYHEQHGATPLVYFSVAYALV